MRKARKGRDYTALRDLGVRAVDDVFKMAAPLLREATDLKENMQVGGPVTFLYFRMTRNNSPSIHLNQCIKRLKTMSHLKIIWFIPVNCLIVMLNKEGDCSFNRYTSLNILKDN